MAFDQLHASQEDSMTNLFLTFRSEEERFGLNIHEVREIISLQKITKVPEQPDFIKGIINLRGNVIPTIDVRNRFGQTRGDYDAHTCIIIVDMAGLNAGLIVDEVLEVLSLSMKDISEPPKLYNSTDSNFISGIGKREQELYMLLECDRLFDSNQLDAFKSVIENS